MEKRKREATQSCLFMTPWTVARQALPSMGILQARVLEWVAISFSIKKGEKDPSVFSSKICLLY